MADSGDKGSWSWPDVAKAVMFRARFSGALLALGLVLLLAPERALAAFGLAPFRDAYRVWVGPATLVLAAVWIVQVLSLIGRWFAQWGQRRKRRKIIARELRTLEPDERYQLIRCLATNTTTFYADVPNPTAHSLEAKGLTFRAPGNGNILAWPSVIWPDVWQVMCRSPHLVYGDVTREEFEQESQRRGPPRRPRVGP